MTDDERLELMVFAHRLADAAGTAILPHFRSGIAADDKSLEGSGFDPVTIADRAGKSAIRELIERQYPEHGIIGEEYGTVRIDADQVWVLDPIDGTKAFISGKPVWGTLIALLDRGRPAIGLIDQPYLRERYWGDGIASQASIVRAETRKLSTRRPGDVSQATAWVSSSIVSDPVMSKRVAALGRSVRMLEYGSDCYSVAMLAEGHIDIVIGYGGFEIYDIAAHIPIVTGAGGIVSAIDGGDALHSHGMIACGDANVHAAALAILAGAAP